MRRTLVLGLAVLLLALARSFADGIGLADESWFLQVVARMRSGDVLYRDVFLGVTPLSAYVTAAVTLATGVEIAAVKVVTNACFAATTVLAGRLARQAGLSSGAASTVMAAMFIWARPYNNPPYTPMAMAFFVAAIAASLAAAARDRSAIPASRAWLGAGALSGLAFASKQNVGLLGLACVCGAVVLAGSTRSHRRVTNLAVSVAGFAVAAFVVLVPVVSSGGLPSLWDYGFAGKGAYLDIGSVSFLDSLGGSLAAVAGGSSVAGLVEAFHGLVLLLPIAVLASAAAAGGRLDRLDWTLILFAAAAALVAFPRWDRFHMAYAVPVHLVALGRIGPRLWPGRPGAARARAAAWAVVVLAALVAARPVVTFARGDRQSLAIAHFRGPLVSSAHARALRAQATSLRQAAGGRPVFVVRPDAGFWYLASGVRNPTPFDIPARTATGANGITSLIGRLRAGDIGAACLDNGPPHAQSLVEVETFVRQHFARGADAGPCTMFTAQAAGSVKQRS